MEGVTFKENYIMKMLISFKLSKVDWWDSYLKSYGSPFFMEIFAIVAWNIWKQRNNFFFDRGIPSFSRWHLGFFDEALLQSKNECK